jgi:hypothetical protein
MNRLVVTRHLAWITLGVLALATACGGGASQASTYNAQAEQGFVSGCVASTGAAKSTCTTIYQCVKTKLSFAAFEVARRASLNNTVFTPTTQRIMTRCAATATAPTNYDAETQQSFVSACSQSVSSQSPAVNDLCTRVYECVKGKVAYADFAKASTDWFTNGRLDPHMQTVLNTCTVRAEGSSVVGRTHGYTAQTGHDFVQGCARQVGVQSSVVRNLCDQVYKCIKKRISYTAFINASLASIERKPVDPKVKRVFSACERQITNNG